MQWENQIRDQSRSAFRTKMGIYFKDVMGTIHEMIQQAKLAYDQGYVHLMWDDLYMHTHYQSRYCHHQ